jgi:hypothetical protein
VARLSGEGSNGQTHVRAKAALKVWSCRREPSLHCDGALGLGVHRTAHFLDRLIERQAVYLLIVELGDDVVGHDGRMVRPHVAIIVGSNRGFINVTSCTISFPSPM